MRPPAGRGCARLWQGIARVPSQSGWAFREQNQSPIAFSFVPQILEHAEEVKLLFHSCFRAPHAEIYIYKATSRSRETPAFLSLKLE